MKDFLGIASASDRRVAQVLGAFAITLYVLKNQVENQILRQEVKIECVEKPDDGASRPNADGGIDDWEVPRLPIMTGSGFKPIFVYSRADPEPRPVYSQEGQDRLIMALMKANDEKIAEDRNAEGASDAAGNGAENDAGAAKRPPFFVDLAANDPLILSNTFLLERFHGWEGLCVEPNPRYWYRLAAFRSCTIIGSFVGGTPDDDGREVTVKLSNARKGGIVGEGMDNRSGGEERRNLVSIATVFKQTNVPPVIDYFSLDVEGAEHLVMKDFPWEKYSFKFMTIERPNDDLKILLQLNGYTLARTISTYEETLWVSEVNVKLSMEEIDRIAEENGINKY